MFYIERYHSGPYYAIFEKEEDKEPVLVCVCVYKKGTQEVVNRLQTLTLRTNCAIVGRN